MRETTIREKQKKYIKTDKYSEQQISSNFMWTKKAITPLNRHQIMIVKKFNVFKRSKRAVKPQGLIDKKTSSIIKCTKTKGHQGDPVVVLKINSGINLTETGQVMVEAVMGLQAEGRIRNLTEEDIKAKIIESEYMYFF